MVDGPWLVSVCQYWYYVAFQHSLEGLHEMCLFLRTVLRSLDALLAWAVLILISVIDIPSLVTWDPRCLNISTCCNKESLSLILHFGVSCFLKMTMVTVFLVFSPKPTAWLFSFMMLRKCCRSSFWCCNNGSYSVISISEVVHDVAFDSNDWKITNLPHDAFAVEWKQVRWKHAQPCLTPLDLDKISKFTVVSYGCCLRSVQVLDDSEVSSICSEDV